MSVSVHTANCAVNWAFTQQIPTVTKFVLVALAFCVTKEWEACLSVPDLAKKTGLVRRSVFYALTQLKSLGLIKATGKYDGFLPIYSVDPCKTCTGRGARDALVGVQEMHGGVQEMHGGVQEMHGGVQEMHGLNGSSLSSCTPHPTPKETPPLPPQGGNGSSLFPELPPAARKKSVANKKEAEPSEDFLTFWDAYPRHVAMKAAWKAWEKASPPLSIVLESVAEHKKTDQWRRGKDYVPHASTFINQERWDDEL